MRFLLGIICKWRGHRWGRPYDVPRFIDSLRNGELENVREKACKRCHATKPVKQRARKAQT